MLLISISRDELKEAGMEMELSKLFMLASLELDNLKMGKDTELVNVQKVSWLMNRIFSQENVIMKDPSAVLLFARSLRNTGFLSEEARQISELMPVVNEIRDQLESCRTLDKKLLQRIIGLMTLLSRYASNLENR